MPEDRRLPLLAGRTMALVGIVLVALNLRTAVAAISPIVSDIAIDIPLDEVGLGLLGMIPPMAFALSGVFGAAIARKLGLERFLLVAIILMIIGHLLRAGAASYLVLLVGSALSLFGMGVGNVLLPPLVKRYFPDRIGTLSAIYMTMISIGGALPALVAVPVTDSASWQASLGIWAVLATVSLLPWIAVLTQRRQERIAGGENVLPSHEFSGRIWHSRVAWIIAGLFAISSFNAYAMLAWLPEILVETAGRTPVEAGALLALYALMGFPTALVIPVLATRMTNVGVLVHIGVVLFVVGYLGLALAPGFAPWLWVMMIGSGPLLFPACLVLINLRSCTTQGSVALSGFVQGLGYGLAAFGPLLVGVLHQWTGGWLIAYLLLIGSALMASIAGVLLRKPVFVEDEVARRATGDRGPRRVLGPR